MDTKRKGDIAELKTLTKLTELGADVSEPYGENTRYDFIVDINNELIKVQVKNGKYKNGKVIANLSSTRYNSSGSKFEYYTQEKIDAYVIYCPKLDELYWVSFEEAPKTGIELRIEEPETNSSLIRWASEYKILDQTIA